MLHFSDPLRQHATDFMHLVDRDILTVSLFKNQLLTQDDIEYLDLPNSTQSEKVHYVYLKIMRLGREGYIKFLICLKDRYTSQYPGHIKLYEMLSTSQQEIHKYQTNVTSLESSLDADNFNSKPFKNVIATHLAISCDTLSDPLRKHATDFKKLVYVHILALVLFQNELLTLEDMEHLQLSAITESNKIDYLILKTAFLGEEGYKTFLSCLKDPYAMQYTGHEEFYRILPKSQQRISPS